MEGNLLLSVIVPVYNAAPYLRKCLDSILHQTYRNLEIILAVDGGCSDGSVEICEEYSLKDARIKLLERPHEGLVSARKAGVAAATGEYVAYVDSDDWMEADACQRMTDLVKSLAPDVLIYGLWEEYQGRVFECPCQILPGYYDAIGMEKEIYPHMLERRYIDQKEILPGAEQNGIEKASGRCVHYPVIHPSVWSKLVKRELLEQTQKMVPDSVIMGEDLVCTLYTLFRAQSVMVTDDMLYHYQRRDDSASMNNVPFDQYKYMFDASWAALQKSPLRDFHRKQLCEWMLDAALLTKYEAFLEKFSELPFGPLENLRIALYGAGQLGQEIYRKTKAVFPERITLWVDQNYRLYQEAGLPVEPVRRLLEEAYDVVVIALVNEVICKEIKQNLVSMSIEPGKVRYVTKSPDLLEAVRAIFQDGESRG